MFPSGLSSLQGPALESEQGLGALTLPGFMSEIAERFGEREALCWRDLQGRVQRWSYAEMHAQCQKVAKALIAAGCGRGSRVGVLISNRPEWLFSTFGAAMAGATCVAMNTFSTQSELQYQLQHADVEFLIIEAGVASKDFIGDVLSLCPDLKGGQARYANPDYPFLRRVICVDDDQARGGIQAWGEFIASGDGIAGELVKAASEAADALDRGLIFFSSGSTALPKAIQQTQRAAMMQCWRFGQWYGVDKDVRTWSANGFFWSGNFAMAFGSTLTVGGCLVLQRFFDPDEAVQLFVDEKVSLPIAWPHQEARLTECPAWNEADLSAMKYVDANLVLATHPAINSTWRQPNGYGMTETFTFIVGDRGDRVPAGTHGPVLPGNTVRIINPDSGELLPVGQSGEITVKGPTLSPGYLKIAPETTFDEDGFMRSGDCGHFTEDGFLVWEGRLSDTIKTGGANVSPTEIDAVLCKHPAVQSTFTVGVPHDTLGEIVVSCVLVRDGKTLGVDELRAYAKEYLASYKVPREVLFFDEEELPMTGSNKIQRPELKKMAQARLEV